MLIRKFTARLLGTNTYVIACEQSRHAAVIDPCGHVKEILALVRERDLGVQYILNTHGHVDHIWSDRAIREATGAKLHIHPADAPNLDKVRWWAPLLRGRTALSPPADVLVQDGDELPLGLLSVEVIHTPGHSPGSVCYRVKKRIFSGDTLFAGAIGSVKDEGALQTLLTSIKDRLLILSDDIRLYPGHGPETTIERERLYNPFVRAKDENVKAFLFPRRKKKHPAD